MDESPDAQSSERGARSAAQIIKAAIKPNDRLSASERLEIYHRQYWFRVIDCIYDDYPGLRALLGGEKFSALTQAYLSRHPSTRFTLRDLGRHLAGFIRETPGWTAPKTRVAEEMARLEWSHVEAFDGGARAPIAVRDLAQRRPDQLRLRLQPYLTLLELGYPLDEFLISLRRATGLRAESSNAVDGSSSHRTSRAIRTPKKKRVWLAVHRFQNRVHYKRLDAAQYGLLCRLSQGETLQEALEGLGSRVSAKRVQEWFADWTLLGWFWIER